MPTKLTNKPLSWEQCLLRASMNLWKAAMLRWHEPVAKEVAKIALASWYETAYIRANALIPDMQRDTNLSLVKVIPGWLEKKGIRNGYVMVTTLLDETPKPLSMILDYSKRVSGGLTYRQLHLQVRTGLDLPARASLRMVPLRPWHRYITSCFPIWEATALPATDKECTHLLGTTLLYYTYVHLRD